ncbi:hypothetical protein MMC30_007806 [Trapelia coarctata]|nr:hypothetical protein [Trapelia coarctata]
MQRDVEVLKKNAEVQGRQMEVLKIDMKKVKPDLAVVCGRDVLKKTYRRGKDFDIGPSNLLLALNTSTRKRKSNTKYKQMQTAKVVDWEYPGLPATSRIYAATISDWATENSTDAAALGSITPNALVSVFIGFPKDRVKHTIEQRGHLYDALEKFFRLRLGVSDEPILHSIETYTAVWDDRETMYPTSELRVG